MEKMKLGAGAAVCAAALGYTGAALATNGDQMLGVTATQWGMAGATTAAPQDAGTVLTNPAGLANLEFNEFRADMGFGFLNPPREANDQKSDSDLYMIPSGALAYRVNEKLTLGMGMAGLSGMGVDFDDIAPAAPGNQNVVTTKQFYKIAPGFGYRVNDKLSLGAALNIDYQSLAIDMNGPAPLHLPQNQVYGYGVTLGATYQATDALRLGLSYISKQEMDEFSWNTADGTYKMDMDGPEQLALGAAFMPSKDLLVEADIKWIGFSDVLDTLDLDLDGQLNRRMAFGWDDQVVYAIGVQKRVNPKTTLRFGYNYGESPIDSEDVPFNIGSLAVTEHHASVGITRELSNRLSGSLSYVRAFNNDVTSEDGNTKIELEQNVINLQISYRN